MADSIVLVNEDVIYRESRIDHAARLLLLQRPKRTISLAASYVRMESVVLVNEDVIYREARIDHTNRLLLQQRPKVALPVAHTLLAARQPPPPPFSMFSDGFASVYSDLQRLEYKVSAANPRPLLAVTRPSTRLDDPQSEDQFRRSNHGLFFRFGAAQGIEIFPNFVEIPDLCDDPWLEWVHRPTDPSAQLFPFRQIAKPLPLAQAAARMLFYQSPFLRVEAETDVRVPDHARAIFPFRQRTVFTPPSIVRVRANRVGFYANVTRNVGDVFDVNTKLLADSTVDYLPGADIDNGWMTIVNPSTTLVTNSPEAPNVTDVSRTVF